jgi:mRNA interferase RelE/StbE
MRYEIVFSPGAVDDWRSLPARQRAAVRDAIEKHLRHEPKRVSRSRIKRLRGVRQPQYRLRVDDSRVFYDVEGKSVQILAIVGKAQAEAWLQAEGDPDPAGGAGES